MSESATSETPDPRLDDERAGGEDVVEETAVVESGDSVVTDDLSVAAVLDAESEDDDPDDDEDEGGENPLETEAEVAAAYLEELLDIADLDGDIDTFIEGDRAHVSIVSESQVLVGADGSGLDALQELTGLAAMTETGTRSRLMLDVVGYRDTRRQQL